MNNLNIYKKNLLYNKKSLLGKISDIEKTKLLFEKYSNRKTFGLRKKNHRCQDNTK
jgi:hypothetical protein